MVEDFLSINKTKTLFLYNISFYFSIIFLPNILNAQISEILLNCGKSSLGTNGMLIGYDYNGSNEARLGYSRFYFCPSLKYKDVFTVELVSQFNNENTFGVNVSYHRNRFLKKSFPFLLGINLSSRSNFEKFDVTLRPEIGINIPKYYKLKLIPVLFFYYGYNGYFIDSSKIKNRFHQLTLRILIPITRWRS